MRVLGQRLAIDPILYFLIGFLGSVCASALSPSNWRFWAVGTLAGLTAWKAKRSGPEQPQTGK